MIMMLAIIRPVHPPFAQFARRRLIRPLALDASAASRLARWRSARPLALSSSVGAQFVRWRSVRPPALDAPAGARLARRLSARPLALSSSVARLACPLALGSPAASRLARWRSVRPLALDASAAYYIPRRAFGQCKLPAQIADFQPISMLPQKYYASITGTSPRAPFRRPISTPAPPCQPPASPRAPFPRPLSSARVRPKNIRPRTCLPTKIGLANRLIAPPPAYRLTAQRARAGVLDSHPPRQRPHTA